MIAARLALLTVSGALAAAGVTGCAQSDTTENAEFTGDASQVANTVRDLDDAYTDEQNDDTGAATTCRTLLSRPLVQKLGGAQGCTRTTEAALKNSDPVKMDIVAKGITIRGDVASVRVRLKLSDDEQRVDTLKLVREGRAWKFDGSATGKKQPAKS